MKSRRSLVSGITRFGRMKPVIVNWPLGFLPRITLKKCVGTATASGGVPSTGYETVYSPDCLSFCDPRERVCVSHRRDQAS